MQIGLILPLGEDQRLGRPPTYTETRDRAVQAEAVGIDSLWVYDHLMHRFPGRPTVGFWEAWTVLSALANATSQPLLGTSVLCAGFRNPAVLAKMATTLDEVSGGRLMLGLGAGWHQPEFDAFGFPFDHRVSRFEEALRIIHGLLRNGRGDFHGVYSQARDCELRPTSPRHTGPPLMIAAFGPRMLRLTAQYADSWNIDWLGPPDRLATFRAALEVACHDVARDPATLAISGGVTIAYPDLGHLPTWMTSPAQYLTGKADEVAAGLRVYADLGVAHALCSVYPNTPAALARFGNTLRAYHQAVNKW